MNGMILGPRISFPEVSMRMTIYIFLEAGKDRRHYFLETFSMTMIAVLIGVGLWEESGDRWETLERGNEPEHDCQSWARSVVKRSVAWSWNLSANLIVASETNKLDMR
jgi:hypothetical protein